MNDFVFFHFNLSTIQLIRLHRYNQTTNLNQNNFWPLQQHLFKTLKKITYVCFRVSCRSKFKCCQCNEANLRFDIYEVISRHQQRTCEVWIVILLIGMNSRNIFHLIGLCSAPLSRLLLIYVPKPIEGW